MSKLIAVSGKGGTGKTTVSASLVRLLLEKGLKPVLAVDADPNHNLAPILGVRAGATISDIREEILKSKAKASGVSKERLLGQMLAESLVEADGFDLLTMGRPEGPSCYCYVNNLLRDALARMASSYPVTVVDNEAGMEHISRMNTSEVDCLVLVSEPTAVSARCAARIVELTGSLSVKVRRRVLVWNKVRPPGVPAAALQIAAAAAKFDAVLQLPFDERVEQLAAGEESILPAKLPKEFGGLLEACFVDLAGAAGRKGGRT